MGAVPRRAWDPFAACAVVLTVVMAVLYVSLVRQQGNPVAAWFVAGLGVAALLGGYGTVRAARRRASALVVACVMLGVLGFLGILSVGLPILVASGLAFVAALRAQPFARADHPA